MLGIINYDTDARSFQAKEYLANPEAFASAAPVAEAAAPAAAAAAKEEKPEEKEEESDDDMVSTLYLQIVPSMLNWLNAGLWTVRLVGLFMYHYTIQKHCWPQTSWCEVHKQNEYTSCDPRGLCKDSDFYVRKPCELKMTD